MVGVLRGVASDISKAIADLLYARLDGTNQPFTGTVQAPEVIVSSLTPTRIVYVDSDDSLTDSTNLTFDGNRVITFGDANNLASIGKSNVFTNGAAGSNSFMAGNSNTLNLTGTANRGFVFGGNNNVTLATGLAEAAALGLNNTAIGSLAIAIGLNNNGSGRNIGRDNTSSGIGIGSQNSGAGVGIGGANTSGSNCYNLGFANDTSGFESIGIGSYNYVRQTYSTSIGFGNLVDATWVISPPVAIGTGCEVYGDDGLAVGSYMGVNGDRSAQFGWASTSTYLAANDTLRITYNGANNIDMTATKTVASVKFEVPDQAFSDSWNGDLSVPTKNAVYDKIITITDTYAYTYFGGL